MGIHIPSSRAADCLVDKYIGPAYDSVKVVADNISLIQETASGIGSIDEILPYVTEISTVSAIAPDVVKVAAVDSEVAAIAPEVDTIAALGANITELVTISNNIDEVLAADDNALQAKAAATQANQYKDAASVSATASEASNVAAGVKLAETTAQANIATTKASEASASAANASASAIASNASELESATNNAESLANKLLSEKWATNPVDTEVVTGKYSAMHWAAKAMENANLTFVSGSVFDPTVGDEYPDVTGIVRDTIWIITLPDNTSSYTFQTGPLAGKVAGNGTQLLYDTPSNDWYLIVISATGVLSVNGYTTSSIILDYDDVGALSINGGELTGQLKAPAFLSDNYTDSVGNNVLVNSGSEVTLGRGTKQSVVNTLGGILKVAGADGIKHNVYSENNKPTSTDVGALPDTYTPDWSAITNKPETATRWPTFDEVAPNGFYTVSSIITGTLPNDYYVMWLPAIVDAAVNADIPLGVAELLVKDTVGLAKTYNITITPPDGYTINGDTSEIINVNFGWVKYKLIGTNYVTVSGG